MQARLTNDTAMLLNYDPVTGLFEVYEQRFVVDVNPADYGYSHDLKIAYNDVTGNYGIEIIVPAGFVTDFASVPRPFWSFIPKMGRHSPAALLHDYLYSMHVAGRPWADAVFLWQMKQDDVPWITRMVAYWAVRLAGRSPYDMGKPTG